MMSLIYMNLGLIIVASKNFFIIAHTNELIQLTLAFLPCRSQPLSQRWWETSQQHHLAAKKNINTAPLKGLSHEINFENFDKKFTELGLTKDRGWLLKSLKSISWDNPFKQLCTYKCGISQKSFFCWPYRKLITLTARKFEKWNWDYFRKQIPNLKIPEVYHLEGDINVPNSTFYMLI
jgi:hypothetical protein